MKVSVNLLPKNWYLLGVEKIQASPTKQDLDTPNVFFFSKFTTSTPDLCVWESLSERNAMSHSASRSIDRNAWSSFRLILVV